jgi:hypothetical protein
LAVVGHGVGGALASFAAPDVIHLLEIINANMASTQARLTCLSYAFLTEERPTLRSRVYGINKGSREQSGTATHDARQCEDCTWPPIFVSQAAPSE